MVLKKSYKILFLVLLLLIATFLVLNAQELKPMSAVEIDQRLNFLEKTLTNSYTQSPELLKLEKQNFEFVLFSYAYATYAATNLALADTSYLNRVEVLIKKSINAILRKNYRTHFSIRYDLQLIDSIPSYSVLYLGHLNLMIGCYRMISQDSSFNELNKKITESLHDRYLHSPSFCLESYPNMIWIPDNTVALASIKLYCNSTKNKMDTICTKWINHAKETLIHKETGVLYSTVNVINGHPLEEPRGSMLGWSINFIYQFDQEFALELYNNYKENFSNNFGIFRLFKEYYNSNVTGMGDIDAGPMLFGYSLPANQFALGNAVLAKDFKTAKKLHRLVKWGTKKTTKNNEYKYKLRLINLEVSPMAEAMVLYSLSYEKWCKTDKN